MPKVRRSRATPNTRPTPSPPARARPAARATSATSAAWRPIVRIAWAAGTLVLLEVTRRFVVSKITWYLAVDQFGYLTFAHDLLHGRIFHEWPVADALAPALPRQTDVLAQTYIWDHGRLWCRYAIGFPIVLAAWLAVFGDDGAPYINTTAFIVLIGVMIVYQWRITRSPWRATTGAVLLVLYPTFMHLWSLTLTRDMVNTLVAFTGLLLIVPARGRPLGARRMLAAGLLLGYAGSIRPDAVLYYIPGGLMVLARWWHERLRGRALVRVAAAGALGLVIGLTPGFVYNYVAQGNPFVPTQGMEIMRFFDHRRAALDAAAPGPFAAAGAIGYPSMGWHGGTSAQVQGGGLKLENFRQTFPGNMMLLTDGYATAGLVAAGVGSIVALVVHPLLFASAASYVVAAMLFYSCWARPDSRYLLGVFTFLPMLIVEGTVGVLDVVRVLARLRRVAVARGVAAVAAAALIAGALVPTPSPTSALPTMTMLLMGLSGLGALAAALLPTRRIVGVVAPAVAVSLGVFLVARIVPQLGHRATFQRPEVVAARYAFGKVVEPGAVVITTEDVGRPLENIEYYSGAHALYLTDITRWHTPIHDVAARLITHHMRPYLLLPPTGRAAIVQQLQRAHLTVEPVLDIPPERAIEYFVAAPFHRGVPLELDRVSWPQLEPYVWPEAAKRPAAP